MRVWMALALAACGRFEFAVVADAGHDAFDDPSFRFIDFTSCPGLAFVGSAACANGELVLTADAPSMVAAAWSTKPFAITATTRFSLEVGFRFGTSSASPADGATITLQADPRGTGALNPAPGGNLGYAGIAPSVALELDVFPNPLFGDPSTEHVGFDRDGSVRSEVTQPTPFPLSSGSALVVWLDYDGPAQQLSAYVAATPPQPATPLLAISDDLSRLGTTVWVGLTASSGVSYQRHHVQAWRFDLTP